MSEKSCRRPINPVIKAAMDPGESLVRLQIGPVQSFIQQARSTRDLWSASHLISWLVATGIRALPEEECMLISPNRGMHPLLKEPAAWGAEDPKDLLTPNIPNLFVASIPTDQAEAIVENVKGAIEKEWMSIAKACFEALVIQGVLSSSDKSSFKAQALRHLSISWQITPQTGGYAHAYRLNGWHHDAVRQTRDFDAWRSDPSAARKEKDSIEGREESLVTGSEALREQIRDNDYKNLFKHNDHLGAVALIKRVWHLAYLWQKCHLKRGTPIRSTRAIAGRTEESDDEEDTDTAPGDRYLAAISFDGDSIGEWVTGEKLAELTDDLLWKHHSAFSAALSDFALKKVRSIVEESGTEAGIPEGFLIYAGGDDVVALVPADTALAIAHRLREAFRAATGNFTGQDRDGNIERPDASAGIAIAHYKAPLQDLIRASKDAEKDAKNKMKRAAFSITLMKRSGETSHWGAKWSSGAIELHDAVFQLMKDAKLSARFPHRVCQLLEPYLTRRTGISRQTGTPGFPVRDVIEKEFLHAATRQGSTETAAELGQPLAKYLTAIGSDPQTALSAVIGLCSTLAFAYRNLAETPVATSTAAA